MELDEKPSKSAGLSSIKHLSTLVMEPMAKDESRSTYRSLRGRQLISTMVRNASEGECENGSIEMESYQSCIQS